jgi:hypothetical protein
MNPSHEYDASQIGVAPAQKFDGLQPLVSAILQVLTEECHVDRMDPAFLIDLRDSSCAMNFSQAQSRVFEPFLK